MKYYLESSALLQEPDLIEKLEGPVYMHELGLRYINFLKKADNPELLPLKRKAVEAEKLLIRNFRKVRVISSSMNEVMSDYTDPEGYLLVKKIVELRDNNKNTVLITNILETQSLAKENRIKVRNPYYAKRRRFILFSTLGSIVFSIILAFVSLIFSLLKYEPVESKTLEVIAGIILSIGVLSGVYFYQRSSYFSLILDSYYLNIILSGRSNNELNWTIDPWYSGTPGNCYCPEDT